MLDNEIFTNSSHSFYRIKTTAFMPSPLEDPGGHFFSKNLILLVFSLPSSQKFHNQLVHC